MTDELDKSIGTEVKQKLSAGSVVVDNVTIDEHATKKGGKVKIVAFHCKHPEKEELIKITNLKLKKVQGNNETITKDAIWYRLESKEDKIDQYCNAAALMRFYNKTSLKSFVGSSVNTEPDAEGYLTIKAY